MSVLLDTNIVLYFLGGRLAEPLPEDGIAVSVVTELELLSFPGMDRAGESAIVAFLERVEVVGLESEVKVHAVRLRRLTNLRLPDAIIAGTAAARGMVLYSNDERLVQRQVVPTKSLRVLPEPK